MSPRALRWMVGAALLGLALPLGASAQISPKTADQDSVQAQKPLRHEVSVVLKLIQLVVLDKNGNQVTDLAKEDFSLTDNGQPMSLTEFERHAPRRLDGGSPSATAPPALLGRKILFLFDYASSDIQGARRAQAAALHFLDTGLQPGDEVGILSYSVIKRLQLHQFLTTDHARVRAIVQGFGLAQSSGRSETEEEQYQRRLGAGGAADARPEGKLTWPVATPEQAQLLDKGLAEGQRYVAGNFIKCLSGLATALRHMPGQKHLVLLSGGLAPGRINADWVLRQAYTELCRNLATANIAVFPINTDPLSAASEATTGAATLREMAQATGGHYFGLVQNHMAHFRKLQTLTAAYYVLGYPINERWDGAYHAIRVEVLRPGCKVRAQAGYLNPKAFAEYTKMEKRIHLVDLALAGNPLSQTPLRFPMAVWPLTAGPADNAAMMAAIPGDAYGELIGRKVEIVRLSFNAIDEIVAESRLETTLPGDGTTLRLASSLTAPQGTAKCRIVIRDLETGRAAVGGADMVILGGEETKSRFLPPLVLRPEKGGLRVPASARAKASAGAAPLPADAKRWLFNPADYAPEFGDRLAIRSENQALLTFIGPPEQAAAITLSAFLLDTLTQKTIALPLSVLAESREGHYGRFLVRFDIPDLPADEYSLVFAAEGQGGPVAQIARDFFIGSMTNR